MIKKPKTNKHQASERQLKVGELIKRVLSQIFYEQRVYDADYMNYSITISEVRVSADLSIAKVYVLAFGANPDQEKMLEFLNKNKTEIRRLLVKEVNLKYAIDLQFIIDNSYDYAKKINQLLQDTR